MNARTGYIPLKVFNAKKSRKHAVLSMMLSFCR